MKKTHVMYVTSNSGHCWLVMVHHDYHELILFKELFGLLRLLLLLRPCEIGQWMEPSVWIPNSPWYL